MIMGGEHFQTLSSDCSQEAFNKLWRISAPSMSWFIDCLTSSTTSVRIWRRPTTQHTSKTHRWIIVKRQQRWNLFINSMFPTDRVLQVHSGCLTPEPPPPASWSQDTRPLTLTTHWLLTTNNLEKWRSHRKSFFFCPLNERKVGFIY